MERKDIIAERHRKCTKFQPSLTLQLFFRRGHNVSLALKLCYDWLYWGVHHILTTNDVPLANSIKQCVLMCGLLFVLQTPECKARVPDLKEGNVYQFRVRAVNKAGPGEPGDATEPHTAKARFRKHYYSNSNFSHFFSLWYPLLPRNGTSPWIVSLLLRVVTFKKDKAPPCLTVLHCMHVKFGLYNASFTVLCFFSISFCHWPWVSAGLSSQFGKPCVLSIWKNEVSWQLITEAWLLLKKFCIAFIP